MRGSLRLPSFIAIPRENVASSSPDRKSRTRQASSPAKEQLSREHQTVLPENRKSTKEEDTKITVNDPSEWDRMYLLDLLATDTSFDWDSDFLSRLNESVVEPKRCTSTFTSHCACSSKKRGAITDIYETTILGALVASSNNSGIPEHVVKATLQLCPRQATCSQLQAGCTPLRAAVWNTTHVLASTLSILVEAYPEAAHMLDEDGLSPLDHCLYAAVLGNTGHDNTERLRAVLKYAKPHSSRSPLIQLLSMMNATNDACILECTHLLLAWDSTLATRVSPTTGCTPLHVAVRNNGSNEALVRVLSGDTSVFGVRNYFGDTILHVVCATGATEAVLRFVLRKTAALETDQLVRPETPHPVIWSINSAGYTPVDLEWIRHIECRGKSRPLDARGVPAAMGSLYERLLERTCQTSRGMAWHHRMQWIVDAALPGHHVSAFLCPHGATMPRPVVDLLSNGVQPCLHDLVLLRNPRLLASASACSIWEEYTLPLINSTTCSVKDAYGRFPLHSALSWSGDAKASIEQPARNAVVRALVAEFPQAVGLQDPGTSLYPFQQAARNPLVSLDTIYRMLRINPGVAVAHRRETGASASLEKL